MKIWDSWHTSSASTPHCREHGKPVSATHGKGKRWVIRWQGQKLAFHKWSDAKTKLQELELEANPPTIRDITFSEYALAWLERYRADEATYGKVAGHIRNHMIPYLPYTLKQLGDRENLGILEQWVYDLETRVATSTAKIIFIHAKQILKNAYLHGLIERNPLDMIKPPNGNPSRVEPWSQETVNAVYEAIADQYRGTVCLGAKAGLRQGEILAMAVDNIDPESISVERQLKYACGGGIYFALPKGKKKRKVPTTKAIRNNIIKYADPVPVTLPFGDINGKPETRTLLFPREITAYNRHLFNREIWRPAIKAVRLDPHRDNGMHALRHYFASMCLFKGMDIKSLSVYLGHSSPTITLNIYAHLIPGADTANRAILDGW